MKLSYILSLSSILTVSLATCAADNPQNQLTPEEMDIAQDIFRLLKSNTILARSSVIDDLLIYALEEDATTVIKYLLERKEGTSGFGQRFPARVLNALIYNDSLNQGNSRLERILYNSDLQVDIGIDEQDKHLSPLQTAIKHGNLKAVLLLLSKGAKNTPWFGGPSLSPLNLAKHQLDKETDPKKRETGQTILEILDQHGVR